MEIMVASLILALAMGGFYQVISMTSRTRKKAYNQYIAVVMANNRIERAKNMRMADLPMLAETDTTVDPLGVPDPNGTFVRSTQILPNQNGDARLTRIIVTVQPPLFSRGPVLDPRPSETVSTLLTEYLEP